MKKILSILLLASLYFSTAVAQTAPMSLTAVKSIITNNLTVVGSDRVTAEKMRLVTNTLAEQIDLKGSAADVANLFTDVRSRTASSTVSALRASNLTPTITPTAVTITDVGRAGLFVYDPSDTTSPDNTGLCLVTASGRRYKRRLEGNTVNVTWWGDVGTANDSPTIQAAVDAMAAYTLNGGAARITILFPLASYLIKDPINCAYKNGIWLSGGAGRYLKTSMFGETGGVMFDFTGSSSSGMSGFQFYTSSPTGSNTPSTIGVLFALGTTNGLYSGISDCWFDMHTNASANGGMGSICILNIRSEESYIDKCMLKGNSPLVLSYSNTITTRNANYTFSSGFGAGLATSGSGSEGVFDITATTINAYDHIGHGITLYGTNAVRFHGYIHGDFNSGSAGSEMAAIGAYGTNLTNELSGTIEGYPTVLYLAPNTALINSILRFNLANLPVNTEPAIYMSAGSSLRQNRIGIIYANGTTEQTGRYCIYTPAISGGDAPSTAYIADSEFQVDGFGDVAKGVSQSLLRNLNGRVVFNFGQASTFENNWAKLGLKLPRTIGTVGAANGTLGVNVARFLVCDKATPTAGNGGRYIVKIKGVIKTGDYSSANSALADFESTITIIQKGDGSRTSAQSTTVILRHHTTSAPYAAITAITADITFSGPYGIIRLIPTVSGSGTSESVSYIGDTYLMTDFAVNGSLIFD